MELEHRKYWLIVMYNLNMEISLLNRVALKFTKFRKVFKKTEDRPLKINQVK